MHQAGLMSRCQALSGAGEGGQNLAPGPDVRLEPMPQGVSIDEFHGQEDAFLEGAHVEHHHHVGVRQLGDRLGFAQQPRPTFGGINVGGRLRTQQFHRYLAAQIGIIGGVHLSHSALADQPQHQIPTDVRSPFQGELGDVWWVRPEHRSAGVHGAPVFRPRWSKRRITPSVSACRRRSLSRPSGKAESVSLGRPGRSWQGGRVCSQHQPARFSSVSLMMVW